MASLHFVSRIYDNPLSVKQRSFKPFCLHSSTYQSSDKADENGHTQTTRIVEGSTTKQMKLCRYFRIGAVLNRGRVTAFVRLLTLRR